MNQNSSHDVGDVSCRVSSKPGKMIGLLGTLVWAISSPVHKYFGRPVDQYQSFDLGIAVVGLTPLVGYFAL